MKTIWCFVANIIQQEEPTSINQPVLPKKYFNQHKHLGDILHSVLSCTTLKRKKEPFHWNDFKKLYI